MFKFHKLYIVAIHVIQLRDMTNRRKRAIIWLFAVIFLEKYPTFWSNKWIIDPWSFNIVYYLYLAICPIYITSFFFFNKAHYLLTNVEQSQNHDLVHWSHSGTLIIFGPVLVFLVSAHPIASAFVRFPDHSVRWVLTYEGYVPMIYLMLNLDHPWQNLKGRLNFFYNKKNLQSLFFESSIQKTNSISNLKHHLFQTNSDMLLDFRDWIAFCTKSQN